MKTITWFISLNILIESTSFLHPFTRGISRKKSHYLLQASDDGNSDENDAVGCFRQIRNILHGDGDEELGKEKLLQKIAQIGVNYGSPLTRLDGTWRRSSTQSFSIHKSPDTVDLPSYLQKVYGIRESESLKQVDETKVQNWSPINNDSTERSHTFCIRLVDDQLDKVTV